jgi:hypothetical protein
VEEIKSGYTRISTILNMIPSIIEKEEEKREVWGFFLQSIDREILEAKCIIGSHVHEAIHADYTGEFFPLSEKEKPYFQSYIKWKKNVQLQIIHSELRLYEDDLKITGAIDVVGKLQGSDALVLIDFKTSASADKKKWPIQAMFYHYLLQKNNINAGEKILFVQLNKFGELPKVHEFMITKNLKTLMASVYNLYKFLTDK